MSKQGLLRSWHADRGYGLVVVNRKEQYFLHTINVVEGPEIPKVGSTVLFEVAPAHKGGKFEQAVNATIVATTDASEGGAA